MPPALYLQRHFVTVLQKDTENMVSEYGSLKDIASDRAEILFKCKNWLYFKYYPNLD